MRPDSLRVLSTCCNTRSLPAAGHRLQHERYLLEWPAAAAKDHREGQVEKQLPCLCKKTSCKHRLDVARRGRPCAVWRSSYPMEMSSYYKIRATTRSRDLDPFLTCFLRTVYGTADVSKHKMLHSV